MRSVLCNVESVCRVDASKGFDKMKESAKLDGRLQKGSRGDAMLLQGYVLTPKGGMMLSLPTTPTGIWVLRLVP